jgi:hypothetical protein
VKLTCGLCLANELHQPVGPAALELGDSFPHRSGMSVELGGGGGEEAAAREDAPLDVREEFLAQHLDLLERGSSLLGRRDHLCVEDRAGGFDRGEL